MDNDADRTGEHTSEEPDDPGIIGSTVEPGDVRLDDPTADEEGPTAR
jgi:hypothetical protein